VTILLVLFWLSIGGIIYVYFGYPLLLLLVSKIKRRSINQREIFPTVTVLIAAYNEEKVIRERIRNCLSCDYPMEKLEVVVGSDGSDDKTNEIVRQFSEQNVKLDYSPERKGKLGVFNRAIPKARGEIVIFSDANSEFDQGAIRKLVRNFSNGDVGCVSGTKCIKVQDELTAGQGESLYWKYESFIKRKESNIHSAMGADGSIYAIRKKLYSFPEEDIGYSDDFIISMQTISQGYRLIYDPEAIVYEDASDSLRAEFKRKIRTLSGGIHGYVKLKHLLNPFRSPIWWQLTSHRILRFLVPYFMTTALISNIVLYLYSNSKLYAFTLSTQCLFYLLAITGAFLGNRGIKVKIFYFPFYFSLVNFTPVSALLRFLRGKTETKWGKIGR